LGAKVHSLRAAASASSRSFSHCAHHSKSSSACTIKLLMAALAHKLRSSYSVLSSACFAMMMAYSFKGEQNGL